MGSPKRQQDCSPAALDYHSINLNYPEQSGASHPSPHRSSQPPTYQEAVQCDGDGAGTNTLNPSSSHGGYRPSGCEARYSPAPPVGQQYAGPWYTTAGSPQPPISATNSSPSLSASRLPKIIAIPATLAKYGSPFLRAYPPSLAAYALPATSFLSFLDELNRVAVKSPPLQVLSLAGNVVGFVPLAATQITGAVINITAEVAGGLIQYGRTEMALKKANADIFGPRGLKVEIAKTEALAKLAGIPGVLNAEGKLDKNARLLMPLEGAGLGLDASGQQRRLDAMRPWIAELDVKSSVPIEVPTGVMSRLDMKISERNRAKGERKLIAKRAKAHEEHQDSSRKAKEEFDKEMGKIDRDLQKDMRNIDDKLVDSSAKNKKQKDLTKLEREREKVLAEYEKDRAKIERRYQRDMDEAEEDRLKDDREEKSMRKLYWLVIRDVDAPSGVGPNPDLPGP